MEHYPVLRRETVEAVSPRPDATCLDTTTGLGGHTAALAELVPQGRIIAADRDAESLERARANTLQWSDRIVFVHAKFSELVEELKKQGVGRVDGLVADLGVSRYQLTDAERGFSLMVDSDLDMRMDRSQGP